MRQTISRAAPKLAVHQVQTYAIDSPLATHTKAASCADVDCLNYANGWATVVDERTEQGQRQAGYIRRACVRDSATLRPDVLGGRRRYTEVARAEQVPAIDLADALASGLTCFWFPPGQECFAEHRVPLDRPELYVVRAGDWRGNPTGWRRDHTRPEHWVEDFSEHQQALHDAHERG